MANHISTALSPKVRHLLCEVGLKEISNRLLMSDCCECQCGFRGSAERQEDVDKLQESLIRSSAGSGSVDVFDHGFIHFTQCAEVLCSITEVSLEEYYVKSVAALAGTFKQSEDMLQDLSCEEFLKIYGKWFLWTKNPKLFQECFELLTHQDGADDLLSLLLLCTGLERALGNLYLLRGQQCPMMLKLLLATKELEDVLGSAAIKVLQVVIGPPMSMNLRNVSWHGFLSENELPRRYIFFLLLLTASLGELLEKQGTNPGHITARDYFPLTRTVEIVQQLGVSELADAEIMSMEECILKSWLVGKGNISFFKAAVADYKHHKFGSCVFLLLPFLEHALRRIFVAANKCPDRLVTAEATTLYTTFEEILDMSLPAGRENALVQVLGEPFMDLLHDLLIYPSGPRVRDKLGHGEADYYSVPESLACILLITLACLAGKADSSLEILHLCSHTGHLHTGLKTSPDLITWNIADGYEIFLRNNDTFTSLQEEFKVMLDNMEGSVPTVSMTEWQRIKTRFPVPFCCVTADVNSMLPAKIRTLYRWQKYSNMDSMTILCTDGAIVGESEIVGILSRIISETETTLTQTRAALKLRQDQLVNKQLRSRQRDNMKRLLAFFPCASLLANYVTVMSAWQFCHLDGYQYLDRAVIRTIQRFLKNTLRTCENLRTLTSSESNKWSQAGEVLVSEIKSAVKFSRQDIFSSMSETDQPRVNGNISWEEGLSCRDSQKEGADGPNKVVSSK